MANSMHRVGGLSRLGRPVQYSFRLPCQPPKHGDNNNIGVIAAQTLEYCKFINVCEDLFGEFRSHL